MWRRARWLAPVTVMIGSAITLIPFVAVVPILPPFGLMMLIGWRLLRPDIFPPWSPLLLGLFDDLLSGQPMGSAMFFWTACFLAVDVIDSRLVWRDLWHNWVIGAGAVAVTLIGGRIVASPIGAHVDTAVLFQIIVSVAMLPFLFRICAHLGGRGRRT
ncbi:rod shape-determining protein MreD [Stakelama sp. CBK3Z-3]|uniref:Rod shape-determining protein MreD n=2 Tax=Stakelama flava TaxID=2860338 RepID=A0ABS6XPG2_9SPHN|nr:rod shape-determining protein MreD [Stakelama flava]MBW4332103.1 rod shape-determining protein MreD [Stakelama flava]